MADPITFELIANLIIITTTILQAILIPIGTIFLLILIKHLTKYFRSKTELNLAKLNAEYTQTK